MKRSEMLKVISKNLKNMTSLSQENCNLICELFLREVELLGMLPAIVTGKQESLF